MKRRVLEKLKLTEISGVDRPCQQGAVVTIMKRAPDERVAELSVRVAKVKQQIATVTKFSPDQPRDKNGMWSRAGGAIARAGRAVGRAAAATGRVAWAGFRAMPLDMQIATIGGGIGLASQGVRYARMNPEQRAEARTAARAHVLDTFRTTNARLLQQHRDEQYRNSVEGLLNLPPKTSNEVRQWGNAASNVWQNREQTRQAEAALASFRQEGRILSPARRPGVSSVPTTGSIPFMITTGMKQELLDRGYTRDQVKNMTPQQAHVALAKRRSNVVVGLFNEQLIMLKASN